jgi:hypothetical protein
MKTLYTKIGFLVIGVMGIVCFVFSATNVFAHTSQTEKRYCSPTPTPTIELTPTVAPTAAPTPTAGQSATPTLAPEEHHDSTPPTFAASSTNAPTCGDVAPTKTGANFHIYRNGDQAIAKWFPTEGNKAHIYYKQVGAQDWQYSKRDIDNTGYTEINGLGVLDITFALQQANGCAGGPLTIPVIDGATSMWTLFR